MPDSERMDSRDWRAWGNGVLERRAPAVVLFDGLYGFGPWGAQVGTADDYAMYAYFIAEYLDTEGE